MNKNTNTKTYAREANQLILQKRFQEATLKCTKVISLDPNNASAYVNWAIALFGLKSLDKAVIKLNRALQIDPDFARAHYNLGLLNYHQGNYGEARRLFRVTELLRTYPQLYLYWGMAFQNEGKYVEAMVKWENMIGNSPKTIIPYIYCCATLRCEDKLSQARLLYEKALGIRQPLQTKSQIVEFLSKDLTRTEDKFNAAQDDQQKEYYNKKIIALRFYLDKILSEWPQ